MKIIYITLLSLLPLFVMAQVVDSLVLKTVDSIALVSRKLVESGEYEKARATIEPAKKLALEKLGHESLAYGSVSNLCGIICYYQGDLVGASKWFTETKSIREKIQGKEHPEYATIINNLGSVYWLMGDYDRAEPLYLESKDLREKKLGKDHNDYIESVGNLGALYAMMGQYEKGEQFMLEANSRIEKLWGTEHSNFAESLTNLGGLYQGMGDYEKSERYLLQSKAIFEKTLGTEHPMYALCLDNLANIYKFLGNYQKAEAAYLDAMAIVEKAVGTMHGKYADLLIKLAELHDQSGKAVNTEALYLQAISIEEKVVGKDDPRYATVLLSLATFNHAKGSPEKAEPLYLEALSIQEKALGKEHPDYASCLHNLGILYSEKSQYDKATSMLVTAKEIREKVLGKRHSDYVASLDALAAHYDNMGEWGKASRFYEASEAINQATLVAALNYLSEPELGRYLKTWPDGQANVFSFTQRVLADESAAKVMANSCFNDVLFYKGYLLNASTRLRRLAANNLATQEQFNLLKSYERRLAEEYAKPLAERQGTAELEEKATNTEKELVRMVAGFAEEAQQIHWQDVQQQLKPDEAAIEFVHYKFLRPKMTDSVMYAALVLLPGAAQPRFIPLFEEKQLERLFQIQGKRKPDWVNQLYTNAIKNQETLYGLIWQPLQEIIAGAQTVYFSPSGLLHRLNLGAIPMPNELRGPAMESKIVADRFRLIELGSTRQLATNQQSGNDSSKDAVLFGGIKYDMDTTAIAMANATYDASTIVSRSRGLDFSQADSTQRGDTWKYLSWTSVEVKTLEPILSQAGISTTVRKEYEATEEAFKAIGTGHPAPRILHLATHGFFFPDPASVGGHEVATATGAEPVFKLSEHPMIRSGLLLAGGNYAWGSGHSAKPGMEDGVLTAYEISQMNLKNTELVVLSACETGLGDIRGNEGVYGLQRAFKIAGAKYLIMSLWQVPDYQTQQLMSTFYRKWLNDKMSIPDAFRSAQQAMREKYKDPFLWAGFVLVE